MAEPVYVVDPPSNGIVGLLALPPLVPPGYFVYATWVALSSHGVHPVFKLATCGSELVLMYFAVTFLYESLPIIVAAGVTAVYMAATWFWVVSHFTTDPIWLGAIALVAAVIGYFAGEAFAKEGRQHATA